jgi:hypothetical protein
MTPEKWKMENGFPLDTFKKNQLTRRAHLQ